MLVLLGGVLGNVAVICLVAWLDIVGAIPKQADAALNPFVFTQLAMIVGNLIPFSTMVGGTRMRSDGLLLLQLLWRSAGRRRRLHSREDPSP